VDVVVIGAGTFGASLAWWLAGAGDSVTLVDQFDPGDRRATSGGETRLLRCAHGADAEYTAMASRARELWRELERESGGSLFVECGVAWFAHGGDGWEGASEPVLSAQGIAVERLDPDAAARLYPSFGADDLAFVLLEPEAGVLRAQRAVQTLAARAAARGVELVRTRARPDGAAVILDDGRRLEGDVVVWSCGPWLGRLFPELVSLNVTCQELLFIEGGPAWGAGGVPAWVDYDRAMYGTADIDRLGVKVATDVEGPPIEPDDELPDTALTEPVVRSYLRARFPALEQAPLRESRCCRYELTVDSNFIVAEHPGQSGVWLVGGGSGHGFKHGPALAEQLAAAFRGAPLPDRFGLDERHPSRSFRTAGSGTTS
jgi:glycine/D-amino acid oxidase-like deaminating enzyme